MGSTVSKNKLKKQALSLATTVTGVNKTGEQTMETIQSKTSKCSSLNVSYYIDFNHEKSHNVHSVLDADKAKPENVVTQAIERTTKAIKELKIPLINFNLYAFSTSLSKFSNVVCIKEGFKYVLDNDQVVKDDTTYQISQEYQNSRSFLQTGDPTTLSPCIRKEMELYGKDPCVFRFAVIFTFGNIKKTYLEKINVCFSESTKFPIAYLIVYIGDQPEDSKEYKFLKQLDDKKGRSGLDTVQTIHFKNLSSRDEEDYQTSCFGEFTKQYNALSSQLTEFAIQHGSNYLKEFGNLKLQTLSMTSSPLNPMNSFSPSGTGTSNNFIPFMNPDPSTFGMMSGPYPSFGTQSQFQSQPNNPGMHGISSGIQHYPTHPSQTTLPNNPGFQTIKPTN